MVVHVNIGLRCINRDVVYFYVGYLFVEDKLAGLVMEAASASSEKRQTSKEFS